MKIGMSIGSKGVTIADTTYTYEDFDTIYIERIKAKLDPRYRKILMYCGDKRITTFDVIASDDECRQLAELLEKKSVSVTIIPEEKTVCPYCGQVIYKTIPTCPKCGNTIYDKNSTMNKMIITLLCVIIVLMVVIFTSL